MGSTLCYLRGRLQQEPTGSFIEESDGLANAILDWDFGNIQNFGGNIACLILFYYSGFGYWVKRKRGGGTADKRQLQWKGFLSQYTK